MSGVADQLSPAAIVRTRLHQQRLAGRGFATPAEVVAWLGAMQSQEFAEAKWAIAQRLEGDWTDADLEGAFARGEILRTHVLRPTWHFVAPQDIAWMLELTSPRVHAANRSRYRDLGLDEQTLVRGAEVLLEAVDSGGPQTRPELAEALGRAGVAPDGQRIAHLVMHTELQGLICSGPRRGKTHTYVALAGRAAAVPPLSYEQGLRELTLRYFTSHGPATVRDFNWWSGLTLGQVREGIALAADGLTEAVDANQTTWLSARAPAEPASADGALMLGTYEEATIAYRDLRVVRASGREADLRRPILLDGVMIGGWSRAIGTREVLVEATMLRRPGRAATSALREEVARFGRFLGVPARLETRVVGG